jgi:hypothetical protein
MYGWPYIVQEMTVALLRQEIIVSDVVQDFWMVDFIYRRFGSKNWRAMRLGCDGQICLSYHRIRTNDQPPLLLFSLLLSALLLLMFCCNRSLGLVLQSPRFVVVFCGVGGGFGLDRHVLLSVP